MIKDIRITLTSRSYKQGENIEGIVSFVTQSPRKTNDFALMVTLSASLHLAIPSPSSIQCHTDRTIYTRSKNLQIKHEQARANRLAIPFSFEVPTACPISARYLAMATLKHQLNVNITDLCLGHDPFSSESVDLIILPAAEDSKGASSTKKQGKITCTANNHLISDAKYFIQIAYPKSYSISSYRLALTSKLHITDGQNSFEKKTERLLSDVKDIYRVTPEGSKLTIMTVNVPRQVESSIKVPGLYRTHMLSVNLEVVGRSSMSMEFPVQVLQSSEAAPVPVSINRATINSTREDPFNLDVQFCAAPRASPRPVPASASSSQFQKERLTHERSKSLAVNRQSMHIPERSLRNLSMDQLAIRAMSPNSLDCTKHVTRSTSSSSKSSSTPPSSPRTDGTITPRSIASSVSSLATSPRARDSAEHPSREVSAPNGKHQRQRSSISILTKRTSAFFGLTQLQNRIKSPKKLEISCCGASELSPPRALMHPKKQPFSDNAFAFPSRAQESPQRAQTPTSDSSSDSENLPETPGSCYSSMPSSPRCEDDAYFSTPPRSPSHAATLARKLSFKRTSTRDVSIYGKHVMSPMQDNRFSISETYLAGFNFEGLSSLDSMDPEQDDHGSAMTDNDAFGLAL